MPPSRDDFARWRDDFVTQWIMRALETEATNQEAAWRDASWVNGMANPNLLKELRTRADAYRALAELNYDGVCEELGEHPSED